EPPLRAVELGAVGLAKIRNTDELAVGRIAPTMVGASEDGGAALVVAAHLHTAVTAGVEEDMDLTCPVAAQDHRLLAHRGHEEVAGFGNRALMTDKEPSASDPPFQFLAVDLVIDKDLAADLPRREIDQTFAVPLCPCRDHRPLPWVLPRLGSCV